MNSAPVLSCLYSATTESYSRTNCSRCSVKPCACLTALAGGAAGAATACTRSPRVVLPIPENVAGAKVAVDACTCSKRLIPFSPPPPHTNTSTPAARLRHAVAVSCCSCSCTTAAAAETETFVRLLLHASLAHWAGGGCVL
eukprot:256190-Chlamydomonas_euryale.AAC.8